MRISCSTLLLLSFVNCDMRSPAAVFFRIFRIRPKDSVFECIIAHWRRDVVYSFSRQTFDRYLRFFGAIVSGPTMHSGSTFILKVWKYVLQRKIFKKATTACYKWNHETGGSSISELLLQTNIVGTGGCHLREKLSFNKLWNKLLHSFISD